MYVVYETLSQLRALPAEALGECRAYENYLKN